jgi:serine/threonine protein phosphatase PrpC
MDLQERAFLEKLKQLSVKEQQKFDLNLSGTSATIMIQTPKKIYLAWVGDCHAVMCNKERKVVAVKLTGGKVLHTPSNEKEMGRIYKNRGEVKTGITLSGDKKPRIYVRGRTFPGISTTRSLGDLLAHHIGVTSEPSVRIINISLQQSERFIAIATDGIWDNMGPEDLIGHINEHGLKEIGQGSEYVCNKARDLCLSDKIPLDDITLVITHLKIDTNE